MLYTLVYHCIVIKLSLSPLSHCCYIILNLFFFNCFCFMLTVVSLIYFVLSDEYFVCCFNYQCYKILPISLLNLFILVNFGILLSVRISFGILLCHSSSLHVKVQRVDVVVIVSKKKDEEKKK